MNIQMEKYTVWIYREVLTFVDWLTALRFTATGCTTRCEVDTNFANESICLLVKNIWNDVGTIHRAQEVLTMLFLYTYNSLHWQKRFWFTLSSCSAWLFAGWNVTTWVLTVYLTEVSQFRSAQLRGRFHFLGVSPMIASCGPEKGSRTSPRCSALEASLYCAACCGGRSAVVCDWLEVLSMAWLVESSMLLNCANRWRS
jgi:hypothetical protein